MKNTRRLLAALLVLAMVLSCLPLSVFAADSKKPAAAPAVSQKAKLGFKSTSFRESNSYRYADNELVRAIVVMEGKPAGESAQNRSVAKAKLAAQHQSLRKSMSKISYTELFEYDSLLNGLAVETAYGNLDAISEMPEVKAVYIANHYDLPRYDVKMESSNEMTALSLAHYFGIQGSGTVIAILDTGMTAGHEAFAVYDGMLESAAISKDAADSFIGEKGYGKYVSQKIPFSYDYADVDNNAEDSTNGHGPHVSGIAAGYAEAEDGAITFMGAAPDAQLLEMKIFNDISEGTDSTIYFAALEDAYELGADVINMSIGAQNGFTYDPELENEVYGNMYQILEDAGVVCSISAGNEYSMAHNASNWAGDGYVTADYADFGTVGSPATYDGNMSIASLENAAYPSYILTVGDLEIPYYDSDENAQFFNAMVGKEVNFVDCGFGYPEDFEKVDVEGKLALISRGDITFQEKVDNAAAAGAVAAIVYNNDAGVIYMSIDPYKIPAASITQEDGEALLAVLNGGSGDGPEAAGTVARVMRDTDKPAKRSDDEEIITATWAELPEDGDCVVLYSEADGVIMAYSAESDDEGEYLTAWNQNTEVASVEGTKLTAAWDDAGILYALDMGDGTWVFVDEYYYDYYGEMYCLYNDGDFVGTIGEVSDGDYVYYELEQGENGWLFKNVGSELYLMIKDGMFYDTEDASKATELSFYVVDFEEGGDDDDDPVIVIDPEAPVMSFPEEQAIVDNPDGWLMSDYSCWGCTPSLTLKPTITGVGGDINSVLNNSKDGYTIYSGTSMAAPNVSGFMAVLLGFLMDTEEELTKVERAAKAEAIAQSTAWVLEDADEYIYSPRKQGAGLIDAYGALNTYAYITEPIQNLYDNTDGVFEFTFTVKNDADYEIAYDVTPVAMYDYPAAVDWSEEEDGSDVRYYNTLTADYLTADDAVIDAPESVTVPAGGTADVTVKITLNDATKEYFDEVFPNGNFIEGYVFLSDPEDEEPEIHATYMGFYGDWTKAPIMEQHDWREVVDLDTWLQTTEADDEGNTYYDYGYTYLDFADFEINTDINLCYALNYDYLEMGQLMGGYAGDNLFDYAEFNEKHIAISRGEYGICDTLYMLPMNLRNVRHMIMVVTDAETGEVYYVDDTEYLPKAYYDEDYGYWSNTGLFMWDGTDADGKILDAADTVVDVTYYCSLPYGEDELGEIAYADLKEQGSDFVEWSFSCTVDNEAPVFSYEYNAETETLTVTATDNQYVAYIALYDGDELVDSAAFSEDEAGKTVTAVFKNVPTDAFYELDVADYASNIVADDVIVGEVEMANVYFAFPANCELDSLDTTLAVPVGSSITMPYLFGDVDGGYFAAWLTSPIDGVISSEDLDSDEYAWIWDEMYFDDDEAEITGDVTFYALFERPTAYADPHDELACCMADQADWSGIWAIDGYDWAASDDATVVDYVMNADLDADGLDYYAEDEYIEYGFFGDGYLIGAKDEHLFEIESIGLDDYGYGIYTIKTADGKYLAMNEYMELITVDSLDGDDGHATWDIYFDTDTYCNVVLNRAVYAVLVFDDETKTFCAKAPEEAEYDDPDNLYLYGPSAQDYEYFTALPEEKDPCEGYTDIDRDAWYHPYADFVIANGLMGSTKTDALTFEPATSCTRSMIVTILYSLAGKPEVTFEAKFPDVKETDWFAAPVIWAYQNGVVTGYDNGNFGPNDKVTREQMAVVLKAFTEKIVKADTSATADLSSFADAAKATWSKPYMEWAVAEGLLSGKASGEKLYLDPQGKASRAEVAAILMSFVNNVLAD